MIDRASAGDTPTSAPALPDTLLAPAVVVAAGADSIDLNAVTRVTAITVTGTLTGTGFALDDGRVATVAHALVDARTLRMDIGGSAQIVPLDGASAPAVDERHDLAAFTGSELLATMPIASRPASLGDVVAVAGFGRDERIHVVTGAVIGRSPGRSYGIDHPDVYAISAPVSEGWSGGPVVNAEGEVIAVVVGQERASGVTVAVPIEHLPTP